MKHHTPARALAALVAVAGLAAAALAVNAQTPPPSMAPPPSGPGAMGGPGMGRMPASDADFVRMLDGGNTSELDMAKYIVNRTKDPMVQQFAQRMIDDHSTAAVKLEAATRGTNLRPAPRDDGSRGMGGRAMAMLQGETGTQLDNDYMRIQVPAHRRMLGLLQYESQNGTNVTLKTLATTLIPTVQQHLQIAQNYLAAHNLTPYSPPDVLPVPGNVNPGNRGAGTGAGVPNNPASGTNGGSTSGQGNASGGTQPNSPVTGPTYQPLGSGTPPPGAGGSTPAPMASATPRP